MVRSGDDSPSRSSSPSLLYVVIVSLPKVKRARGEDEPKRSCIFLGAAQGKTRCQRTQELGARRALQVISSSEPSASSLQVLTVSSRDGLDGTQCMPRDGG